MRRAVPALIISAIGLVALATFKTTPATSAASAHASAPLTTTTPPTSAPPPTTSTPPTTSGAPPRRTRQTSPPPTTPPTTAAPRPTTRTFTGQEVDNQYGPVQVQITVQGHTVTDVQAVQLPSDRARSAYISQQAGPLLRQEALQAQSAQIDGVSGATYTSQSYAQSLQSALDSAGI
jgi:uncharacterized protein with FMN-binding domain